MDRELLKLAAEYRALLAEALPDQLPDTEPDRDSLGAAVLAMDLAGEPVSVEQIKSFKVPAVARVR